VKGVLGFAAAKLKRADEEGRVVPAIVLSLTLVALLPAAQSALAALGRTAPVRLRVLMEGFPEHLTVYVSVYNLTERGAVRVARASGPASALPPDGLTFDFAVHKVPLGLTEIRGVKKVRYEIYPFNVFAYAYDAEGRELYAASAYVTVSPEQYEYVVELKARKLHSKQVSADQVPAPNQYQEILDQQAREIVIVAYAVPAGVSCYMKVPAGSKIPIETFEKMYWTDDPTLQTWTEENWEATGFVDYEIDLDKEARVPPDTGDAGYLWPSNVDYVIATVGEGPSPLYIVRVLKYAKNINHNTIAAGPSSWAPCSGGTFLDEIKRPCTATITWSKYTGYRVRVESFSVSFKAIIGNGTVKVEFPGIEVRFKIEEYYITFQVSMVDWSKAPLDANYLRIYACDNERMQVRAQYEP